MAQIQTVRGPIDSAQLGTTLMHEHVFVLDKEISENYPENWGLEEKRVADAVSRLNELKSRGVDTIVDLTVIGLGRYIPRIQRIAEQTQQIKPTKPAHFEFHFSPPGGWPKGRHKVTFTLDGGGTRTREFEVR